MSSKSNCNVSSIKIMAVDEDNISFDGTFYDDLEEAVTALKEYGYDPEEYKFLEVDIANFFRVQMKAVRKEIAVRIKKG